MIAHLALAIVLTGLAALVIALLLWHERRQA